MRVNVQKFSAFWVQQHACENTNRWFSVEAPMTVEEALQRAKQLGYTTPIVEPCIDWEHHEMYRRTLQQQARAAFHLQEQEKLGG